MLWAAPGLRLGIRAAARPCAADYVRNQSMFSLSTVKSRKSCLFVHAHVLAGCLENKRLQDRQSISIEILLPVRVRGDGRSGFDKWLIVDSGRSLR